MTDLMYVMNIDQTQQYLVQNAENAVPVYYYQNFFDYDRSLHRLMGIPLNGTLQLTISN